MGIERQPTDSLAEKRYAPRRPVALTLHAWVDGTERNLIVRDLSHTGFMAETVDPVALGQTIELEFPNGMRRDATVVWAGKTSAGCTFATPISKGDFSAALLKSDFAGGPATQDELPAGSEDAAARTERSASAKLPVWARLTVIGAASVALWAGLLGLGWAVIA